MNYKQCNRCGSEFVCWNWIHMDIACAFKSWIATMKFQKRFRNPIPFFRDSWAGECWTCDSIIHTFFKVRNGIPNDVLNEKYVYLPEHDLKDTINELNYLFYSGYNIWSRNRLDERLKIALDHIETLINDKFDTYKEEPKINEFIKTLKEETK